MEPIKPQNIERGMVIVDEVNSTAYVAQSNVEHVDAGQPTERFYVKGLALTNWGSVIEYNSTYLPQDGELYVVSRPAPFVMGL